MKTIKVISIPTIVASLTLCLWGCAAPKQTAAQNAANIAAQQKAEETRLKNERDASLRLEHVKQNWSKLQQGMSVDEADALVGPFTPQIVKMYKDELKMGNAFAAQGATTNVNLTVPSETYTLMFHNGKLKSWQLVQ